jgi:hypothetical protein
LAMQFKDHDDLPKSGQRRAPQSERAHHCSSPPATRQDPAAQPSAHLGNFQPAQVGIIRPALACNLWHGPGALASGARARASHSHPRHASPGILGFQAHQARADPRSLLPLERREPAPRHGLHPRTVRVPDGAGTADRDLPP